VKDPQRRRRIEEVCDAALDRDAHERPAFVAAACAGDETLRSEVEALLAHAQSAEAFLAASVGDVAMDVMGEAPPMASLVGQQIGSYRIGSLLGAGGMGEVYRASDGKLGRDVAIKVLPEVFLSDPERVARFEREAKVLATLNHPHIGAIYGLEEADISTPSGPATVRALVLELVEGETLAERIALGPLPIQEALTVARQIADAIDAAHEKGIVHRDLKPGNVKITPAGMVKVLDFGLAKVGSADGSVPHQGPTVTAGSTREGLILGTAAYMSPEQARGKPVDKRTDIWAFGCVLYEMLTGRPALAGETVSDTIAAILEREPEWQALPGGTPASVRSLLKRCLEKDPRQRLRDIGDARLELDHALAADVPRVAVAVPTLGGEVPVPTRPSRWFVSDVRAWRWLAAAIVLTGVIGAALFWRGSEAGVGALEIRSIAVLPLQNMSGDPEQEYFSDGTTEALISRLAQVHTLDVISRTSVMQYKKTTKSLRDIGRELGVDAIVEGSVQRAGGRVRITAQLIGASTDRHLWSGTYERDMVDILKVEADAATAIAQQIHAYVSPDETRRLRRASQVQPAAHEEYLRGRNLLLVVPKQAVEHFRRAIQLQPDYAPAHADLSNALQNLRDLSGARVAADQALQLDPELAEAHTALAGLKTEEYDWRGAEEEFQRALNLNPYSLSTCICYSVLLRALGRFPEARALIERAAVTDPLSSAIQSEYGIVLYFSGNYQEAVSKFERALELNAGNRLASYVFALNYLKLGEPERALAVLDRPEFRPSAELGLAYAALGRRTDALNTIAALEKQSPMLDAVTIAAVYFTLGDKDRGYRWLTRAFDERQLRARFVKFHPMFDNLRSEPRFTALVETLKIPT